MRPLSGGRQANRQRQSGVNHRNQLGSTQPDQGTMMASGRTRGVTISTRASQRYNAKGTKAPRTTIKAAAINPLNKYTAKSTRTANARVTDIQIKPIPSGRVPDRASSYQRLRTPENTWPGILVPQPIQLAILNRDRQAACATATTQFSQANTGMLSTRLSASCKRDKPNAHPEFYPAAVDKPRH